MKKEWVRPLTTVQCFEADEYVAACWDIHCNVPSGTGYYETNGIEGYQDTQKFPTYQAGDTYIASGYGCNAIHTASGIDAAGPAANAKWEDRAGNVYDVFYFKARVHGSLSDHFCTLDGVHWEENPNAS